MKAFKIMERSPKGSLRTLFHALNGSRVLPLDTWIFAKMSMVKDGTSKTSYIAGWHVLPTYEDAETYLKRFRNRLERLEIIPVEVDGIIWPKAHSPSPTLLAQCMRIAS